MKGKNYIPIGAPSGVGSRCGPGRRGEIFSLQWGTRWGWGAGILAGTGAGNMPRPQLAPSRHSYPHLWVKMSNFGLL